MVMDIRFIWERDILHADHLAKGRLVSLYVHVRVCGCVILCLRHK